MQGVLNSLNGATITNASVLDGLNLKQAQLLLTTKGLSAEKQKELLVNAGLMASEDKVTLTLMKQAFMSSSLGDEEKERALIKLGLIDRNTKEAISEAVCTKKDIEALVAQGLLNEEQKEGILAILGLDTANKSASVSLGLFTKGIWANIKAMAAWMISNPLGWIILLGGTIAATVGLVDLFTTSVEEHREKLENLKSEYSDVKSELDGLKGELDGTQSRINELESKGKLTFTEAEELNNLRKQNNELQRSIDLLEFQNKTKKKELNNQFVETMNSDIEQELYTRNENGEVVQYMPMSGQTATDDNEANYITQRFKDLEKLRDELSSASTEAEKERIKRQIKGIEDYFVQKNKDFTETAEGIDYIQNPTTKDDEKVNEWLDYINNFQDKMAIAMGGENAKENAFNRLVDNWKFDEALNPLQKLGKEGKVTLEELKKRMSDPVFVEFVNKLKDIGFISDTTDGSLKFLASAFNGTTQAARSYVNQLSDLSSIKKFIGNIDEEAKALGTTKEALGDLVQEHILFNNTGLDTSSQISALQLLGSTIDGLSGKTTRLISLLKYAAGDFSGSKLSTDNYTEEEIRNINARRQGSAQSELDRMKKEWEKIQSLFSDDNGNTPPYSPTNDDKGSSKDNTPDYEDPTDAIINRINLRSKELEQQEDSIQNAREIAELENDYKKQISSTNDLISNRKKRVDELAKANAGLHNEAEWLRNSNPWDEESWFDNQGNATESFVDFINGKIRDGATTEDIEAIKDLFEKISKYKKAYMANEEEIADLNKQILQDEEKIWDIRREIFDARMEESEYYIQHSKDFGWENGDNEIAARKRVLEWIQSDYYKSLIKNDEEYYKILEEHRLNYIEAQKEEFNKTIDFASSYLDSQKTLLQSYYDVTNNIAEAQHEINKELETSKTMYEWLDEDTRKLLFNQEDYNILSEELYDIQYKAEKLQRKYQYDLEHATLNTIEEITSNYEMQYEMLMKSYEIAKAELEVAKKKAQLNNVLNERNVRMFIDGQWQWVANTQDVINAKSELADAEYAKKTAEAGERQAESINNLTEQQNKLNTIVNGFGDGVLSLDQSVVMAKDAIGSLSSAIQTAIRKIRQMTPSSSVFDGIKVANIHEIGGSISVTPYASGTNNTVGGNVLLGEREPEIFIDNSGHLIPINQPTLGNFGAGGVVFNQEQMAGVRELWDLSNLVIPSTSIVNNASARGENLVLNVGDIIVNNPADAEDVANNVVNHIVQGLKLQRKSR